MAQEVILPTPLPLPVVIVCFPYSVSTKAGQNFFYTGGKIRLVAPPFSGESEAEYLPPGDKGAGGGQPAEVLLCDAFFAFPDTGLLQGESVDVEVVPDPSTGGTNEFAASPGSKDAFRGGRVTVK